MKQVSDEVVAAVVVIVAGLVGWFVRNLLTNGRKIEILEQNLKVRDELRKQEMDRLIQLEKALESGIMRLHDRVDTLDEDIKELLKIR